MRLLSLLAVAGLASCVRADMVALHRSVGGKPTSCMPGLAVGEIAALANRTDPAAWRADLQQLVDEVNRCPVVDFDEQLSPIGAGFVTFGGFASDMAQKRRDQLLGTPERGGSVAALCPANAPAQPCPARNPNAELVVESATLSATEGVPPPADLEDFYLMNFPEPAYTNVWFPVARLPPSNLPAGTCSKAGAPSDDATLCVFGRVALQQERTRPVILVGHGLFDSSAHHYVRNTGASLFAMGFSVALLDLRDHGNTLRANGLRDTGATFGPREAHDLVAIARQLRDEGTCRAGHAGYLGYSGGAAMGVHAYAADAGDQLDLGVLAVSPLVDPADTIGRLARTGKTCPLPRAVELPPRIYFFVGATAMLLAAIAFFLYAWLAVQSWPNRKARWRLVGLLLGIGFVVGGLAALLDPASDGGSTPCISATPVANLYKDLLEERWRALGLAGPPGLDAYAEKRSGISLEALKTTANDLPDRVHAAAQTKRARLVIVTADDDPVVSPKTVARFRDGGATKVAAFHTHHGGHVSFAVLSPVYARRFIHHFFCSGSWTCPRISAR